MVGSARIDFNSIQWIGREGGAILRMDHPGSSFGFTGQPSYQTDAPISNVWILETPSAGMLPGARALSSAYASHYFAPDQAGSLSSTAQYLAQTGTNVVPKNVEAEGEGVADSNEAITLSVEGAMDCATAGAICEITLNPGNIVGFTVTPHVNQSMVPAGMPVPEYVMTELIVQEVNTGCSSDNLSFDDNTATANNFSQGDYFHYLYGSGPYLTPPLCIRQIPFLVSAEKSFDFKAIARRNTGNGYVDYTFFIRGHYDPSAPEKRPDSHKTFRIRVVSRADSIAFFDLPVSYNMSPATSIRMDGTSSGPSSLGNSIIAYNWEIKENVSGNVVFSSMSEAFDLSVQQTGDYTVTLIVTDDAGQQSRPLTKYITVISPEALFTLPASYDVSPATPPFRVDGTGSKPSSTAGAIIAYNWEIKESVSGAVVFSSASEAFDWPVQQVGDYAVTLIVTDDTGGQSPPATENITLTFFIAPEAVFDMPVSYYVSPGTSFFRVDGTSSSPSSLADAITAYSWEIKELISGTVVSSFASEAFDWSIEQAGDYAVTLIVTDDANQQSPPATENITLSSGLALSSIKTVISDRQEDGAGTPAMVWLTDADGNSVTNAISGKVTLRDAIGTINTTVPFLAGQPYVIIELGGMNGEPLGAGAGDILHMVAAYANDVSSIANSSKVPISVVDDYLTASINSSVFDGSRPASRDPFDGFNVALDSRTPLGSKTIRVDHILRNTGPNMLVSIDSNETKLNLDGTFPAVFVNGTGNISTADEFYLIGDTAGQYGQAIVMNQGMDANPDITGGGGFNINPVTAEISVVNSPGVDGVSGVSVGGDAFKMSRTVSQTDNLTIAYTYNVDPAHREQSVGLMLIGLYVDTQGLFSELAELGSPYPAFIYNKT
ncbi:MAG: hypothetical protein GY862_16030, partial [Gammaproteobacteria bacterium]|nr:hypothetical protein [Gammaproteobacteria bacterium]